jgi:hypothetical protein
MIASQPTSQNWEKKLEKKLLSSLSWKSPGMHNTKVFMFMGIAAHATCEP